MKNNENRVTLPFILLLCFVVAIAAVEIAEVLTLVLTKSSIDDASHNVFFSMPTILITILFSAALAYGFSRKGTE